ncbi:MAG: glycosyltransferase family 4 protein [Desulfomonilaceae bacterium]
MRFHLVLFFTRGVSLRTWAFTGMLDREIAIYQRLIQQGAEVSFVTYGDHSDLDYLERLGKIKILCNVSSEPLERYEENLLELHGKSLRSADVIKTNQTYGAQIALRVARELGVPLVARCGYLWSANAAREYGKGSEQARAARCTEEEVFSAADAVVVTTSLMERDIASRIPGVAHKIEVIPNYVDTDLFRPMSVESTPDSVLFVGRIAPEKNLDLLLEALASLPARLRIIGEGRLRPTLQNRFSYLDDRVTWEGTVAHRELPRFINEAATFVLPSRYEGHPKALLEAMACEAAVVGGDSPGIREIITHGENGLLCELKPFSLRETIRRLIKDSRLRRHLGKSARRYVLSRYSLEKIAKKEWDLLCKVLTHGNRRGESERGKGQV